MIFGVTVGVQAAGFLRAESFPGTFQDLSFEARLNVMADGYDAFEAKFEGGKCVSGCPYMGISVAQMDALINQNTAAGNAAVQQMVMQPSQSGAVSDVQLVQQPEPQAEFVDGLMDGGESAWRCSYHSEIIKSNNLLPTQAPLDCALVVTSDYGWRNSPTQGASTMHNGIDLSAVAGTPVFAPASGTVVDLPGGACGIGITIDHGGGWKTKYCHLSKRNVNIGEYVQSGCQIGAVGNTGVSTGAHLHYAVIYQDKPYDPLYKINHLGRNYRMDNVSLSRPDGIALPGRI